MYLEVKSETGTESDAKTFVEFENAVQGKVWQPPLGNIGVLHQTAFRDKSARPLVSTSNDC